MNTRTRIFATLTLAATLMITSFSSSTSVLARSGCQRVKGNESVINNGNGTTKGTITQSGRLSGTTQSVFTSGFTPTPDPNTFSFTDILTITTEGGTLLTHNVTLFDVSNGVFSAIARIDPTAGAGEFVNATGVLYINGKTTDGGATFQGDIIGEICSAN